LKVLAIAETFFLEQPTGLARVAWDVCRELAHRGHDVELLCPSTSSAAELESQVIDGVHVVRFRPPSVSRLDPRNPWIRVRAYRRAIEAIADSKGWDAIHCHGIYGVAAALLLPSGRPPIVHSIHSPAVEEQAWNWAHEGFGGMARLPGLAMIRHFERLALRGSAVCHTLSDFTRRRIERLYPQAVTHRWAVIPHWVDESWERTHSQAEARQLLGWKLDQPVVLSVRQLRPRYGLDDAIRSLARLIGERRCDFRIVGSGESRRRLEALSRDLGIQRGVVFEGSLSEQSLRLAYQAADVFLLPSRALECFGLIAQEAMASGLPVVATCVGAIPEILAPITPQLLVPPGDHCSMARTVAGVLDKSINVPPASAVVDHVTRRYSRHSLGDAYERLFLSLTA
jgi:glycosyltransferase involved in cell wall biosynthesis